MLDRTNLRLVTDAAPETRHEFEWRVEGDHHELTNWIWRYQVYPNSRKPGEWVAVLYRGRSPYSMDERATKQEAIAFCEQHASERLGWSNDQKARELGRVAPLTLRRILDDAAVQQGLADLIGDDIVYRDGLSAVDVDLDGEGVCLG